MPEELVEVFSDDGEAGTKRPKDKVKARCIIVVKV